MFKRVERMVSGIYLRCTLLMIFGIVGGCAMVPAKIAAPVPPSTGDSSLVSGRKIYVSLLKCAMCHRPKPVSDYSVETWTEEILPRMSQKAKLSPEQYADVLAYVTSATTHESSSVKSAR